MWSFTFDVSKNEIVGFRCGVSLTTLERRNLQNKTEWKTRKIFWRVYGLGLAVTEIRAVFMFFACLEEFLNTRKFFQRIFSCKVDISNCGTEEDAGVLFRPWQVWILWNQVGSCSFSSLLCSVYFHLFSKWCLIVLTSKSYHLLWRKINTHINKPQAMTLCCFLIPALTVHELLLSTSQTSFAAGNLLGCN
jgi:hypothetical protein